VKRFYCDCGQRVFFDNSRCLACGRDLGFDPLRLRMTTLAGVEGEGVVGTDGTAFRQCGNTVEFDNCNWLLPAACDAAFCISCRANEVIPNLGIPGNLELWSTVERAKRRLLYTLLSLGLSIEADEGSRGLRFRLLEDRRRNPEVQEAFVLTGHFEGVVTINIAEADDAVRHELRARHGERHRTVLGHLRHEAGHFFFPRLTAAPGSGSAVRRLFGDEGADYPDALKAYYDQGPPPDWPQRFVTAYAAAHPHEDFAETFAHYLHIVDALETADAAGLTPGVEREGWIDRWMALSLELNELNRSLGLEDPYPFVLSAPVIRKLKLIDHLVRRPVGSGPADTGPEEAPRTTV